jgi:hypothetical protein
MPITLQVERGRDLRESKEVDSQDQLLLCRTHDMPNANMVLWVATWYARSSQWRSSLSLCGAFQRYPSNRPSNAWKESLGTNYLHAPRFQVSQILWLKQNCMKSGCGIAHALSGEAPIEFSGGSIIERARSAQDGGNVSVLLLCCVL